MEMCGGESLQCVHTVLELTSTVLITLEQVEKGPTTGRPATQGNITSIPFQTYPRDLSKPQDEAFLVLEGV